MGKSPTEHSWMEREISGNLSLENLSEHIQIDRANETVQILVVDDDPSFGKILNRIGQQSQVHVTVCQTSEQLHELNGMKFHAAIIDYDLGYSDGIEVARKLDAGNRKVPVILVSQSQLVETPISCWPPNIKGFLHKALGHFAILEAALAAHDASIMVPAQI